MSKLNYISMKLLKENKMRQSVNARMAQCSGSELSQALTDTLLVYSVRTVSRKTPSLGL